MAILSNEIGIRISLEACVVNCSVRPVHTSHHVIFCFRSLKISHFALNASFGFLVTLDLIWGLDF